MNTVDITRDGPVAIITLNRPEQLNAFAPQHVPAILDAFKTVEADRATKAAVLTGAGRAFCAGGDISASAELLTKGDALTRQQAHVVMQEPILALRRSRLPIVASVHGAAYGAGFSMALASDLVVAARDARFCQAFLKRNVTPDLGSAWLLPRAVGSHRARELIYLADAISGEEAHRLGIVNRLADTAEEALTIATELAQRLAKISPSAFAMSKALINRSESLSLEDSMTLEQYTQTVTMGESVTDFLNALKTKGAA